MPKDSKSHYAILGVLAIRPGISGYDIEKFMQSRTNCFWKEGYASIYPGLAFFVKNKWVVKSLATEESARRKRYTYVLSDAGREELKKWIGQPVQEDPIRHELILKLFLGGISGVDVAIQHVENYQKKLLQTKENSNRLNELIASKEKESQDQLHRLYWDLSISYGDYQFEADLRWCKEALKALKRHRKAS